MEHIIYDNEIYNRLLKDNDKIIKYSYQALEAWFCLMNKNLNFLNIPINCTELSLQEKNIYPQCLSKIELPYLKDFYTLYKIDFMHTFDNEQILLLLKKILLSLKVMHTNCVYHGDLFSKNIMINKNLDFCFIDLDAAIVDNIISLENTYYDDNISFEEKKLCTQNDDKINILFLFLYFFINGNFDTGISYNIDIKKLYMPEYISKELNYYIMGGSTDEEYYFIDIVDELLSVGYEAKIKLLKK